jgi:hypothetical protein
LTLILNFKLFAWCGKSENKDWQTQVWNLKIFPKWRPYVFLSDFRSKQAGAQKENFSFRFLWFFFFNIFVQKVWRRFCFSLDKSLQEVSRSEFLIRRAAKKTFFENESENRKEEKNGETLKSIKSAISKFHSLNSKWRRKKLSKITKLTFLLINP